MFVNETTLAGLFFITTEDNVNIGRQYQTDYEVILHKIDNKIV